MKAFRFSILAALVVLLAGCQEEIWPNGRVEEGIPTSLDFTVSVPAAEEVTVTRAAVAEYESEIRELMLIMFEAGGRKMVLDVTPYLGNGAGSNIAEGHRVYTLTSPIEKDMYGGPVLTGNYKVYAVANWSGSFAGLSNLDQLSEEELVEQIAQNTGFVYSISGAERFPMSCVADVTLAPEGSSLKINLKRLVSRIEFTFKNGQSTTTKDGKEVDENPNFTPTSYTIYNIPGKANLFSKADNRIANGSFSKSSAIALTSREFEFFMLENIQNAKQDGCVRQDMREYWTGGETENATAPEDKDFLYAPEDGTFVVVSGTYNGTSYIGEVSYTIHLGNFSEGVNTANGKDFSNFKVNRNERQKYTVTVNGVKSIYTEVTDSEVNPGVEGSITETAVNTFVLDAHYEKVMMNVSEIGNPSYLFVNTPYCKDNNGHALVNLATVTEAQLKDWGLDYEWVHFMKPDSQDEFPTFKMADSGNIWQLIQDILDGGDAQYYANIGGVLYTAAFVDEYFYEGKDWQTFVNTNNRTMSIRPGVEYSDDGNSSLVQNSHIELSQRSIKTTYAFDGKDPVEGAVYVPFGIETWDETGKNYFYGTSQTSQTNGNNYNITGLTDDNGWNNTWLFTNGQIPANPSKAGYLASVSDNSKESHVYSAYTALAESSRAKGYNACLLRNRDENNDGYITGSELKWYLPAIDQYTNIWLSEDLLHEDTQLFDRANLSSASDALNKNSVYYTSSAYQKRLYWALEGASYGRAYGGTYDNARNGVRCVRNLVSKDKDGHYDDVPSSLTELNGNIISAQNITAVRTIAHTGEYGIGHRERSEDNKLPGAFEIARGYLGETIGAGASVTIPAKTWLVLNTSNCSGSRSGSYLSGYTYSLTISISPIEGDSYTCNGTALNSGNGYTATFNNGSSTTLTVIVTKADGSSKSIPVSFVFSSGRYNDVEYDGEDPEQTFYDGEIRTGKGTGSKDKFSIDSFNATDLCSTGYYQQLDKSDLGMWRVPNQREFMLMLQYDLLISDDNEGCISSTFLNGTFKTQPFSTYNAGITLDNKASSLYVRCVMDAQVIGGGEEEGGEIPPVTPPVSGGDEGGEA